MEGAVRPTSRRGSPFKVQRSVKVPHGESPQLRKVAARAHVDQAQENHAGARYHGCVAAASGSKFKQGGREGRLLRFPSAL